MTTLQLNKKIDLFKQEHRLSNKDTGLLIEAYRHYIIHHAFAKLPGLHLGYGTPSNYTGSKYFQPIEETKPRKAIAWELTQEGRKLLVELFNALRTPKASPAIFMDRSHRIMNALKEVSRSLNKASGLTHII